MPHTKEELIKLINLDEPEYDVIVRQLSQEDIPLLVELSKDSNPGIATKAISCLGLMNSDQAAAGLQTAVEHNDPVYRVAAAHALRNLPNNAQGIHLLDKLLDDSDIGVRKFALKSVDTANITSLREKVRQVNLREQNEGLKAISQSILRRMQ